MWRTGYGERTLEEAEAVVFAEALLSLLDEAVQDQFDDYQLGISCFDNLTYGQQISVLVIVGNGLLSKDVAPIELTAVVEGAIAAFFRHLSNEIIPPPGMLCKSLAKMRSLPTCLAPQDWDSDHLCQFLITGQ
jgi:hypothetical protein